MNIMPIPKKNYTIIQNDIFNNYPNMSSKSKFMLLQLLSKYDHWNLNMKWLVSQNSDGMHAVRSAVQEWEDNDFLHRFIIRKDGRIKGIESVICYPPISRENAKGKFQEAHPDVRASRPAFLREQITPESTTPVKAKTSDVSIPKDATYSQVITTVKTAPITNTDNYQILRETTTAGQSFTCNQEEEPEKQQQLSTIENYNLLDIIPEPQQQLPTMEDMENTVTTQ